MLNKRIVAAALLAGILSVVSSSRGQVLAERVPSDAIAYAGWAGSDALGEAYNASHLKAFLEAFNAPQIVTDAVRLQMDLQGNREENQFAMDLLSALAKSPGAMYIGPIETTADQPQPRVAFFSKVGKDRAADLAKRGQEAMKRNPNNDGKSEIVAAGEFLLLQTKNIDIKDRLLAASPTDGLSGIDTFKKSLAKLGPDAAKSAIIGYMDGPALMDTIADALKKVPDPQAQKMLPAILTGMGANSVRQAIWAGNFDGADWKSTGFVGMRDHRNGVLAFMDNPPLTDASLKLIPKNATEAGAFRFDGVRLLKDVADAAAGIDENTPKQIETVITEIYKVTGIDMKRDLFPSLGDEFVYYSAAQPAGNSIKGLTLINRLRDPVRGKNAIDNMENFLNLLILQRDPESKIQFKPHSLPAPLDKIEAHEMTFDRIMPSWAIVDGILYFSMSEEGLVGAIQQTNAKDSILDNPVFTQMRDRLGKQAFSSFDFVNLPVAATEMYRIAQRDLGAMTPAPNYKLPALNTITPSLAPVLSLYWSDQEGFHAKSSGPFPLAGYLRPSEYLWIRMAQLAQARRNPPAATSTAPAGLP